MSGSVGSDSKRSPLVTRRRLLQSAAGLAAVAAAPGVLAACGGGGIASGTAETSGASAGRVGGTLDYLGWEGVDLPQVLAPWVKQHHVKLESAYIAGLRDIGAKYAAGGGDSFDIIGGSSNGIPLMQESGVPLLGLNEDELPNLAGMNPFFRESPEFRNADGELVAVPFTWGVMGISYDSTKMSAPTEWADLLKPEFKGKITILDDAFTVFFTAAPTLGMRAEEMTPDEFEILKSYVAEVLAQAKTITPTFGDMANLLASEEVIAAWCGFTSINAFAAEAGNNNIRTAINLKEGSASFAEIYSIPSTGQNPATAYAMINEVLDPTVNAEAADALVLAPTVDASWEQVNSTVRGLFPKTAGEREKALDGAPLVVNAPLESDEFVTFREFEQAWIELKAAA